jgi:transcription-repair coupling factor (superfamily II helicase)
MIQELQDRFGNVPTPVDNLLRINLLRIRAHRMYLTDIRNVKDRVQFVIRPDARINPDAIPAFIRTFKGNMSFTPVGTPTFTYRLVLTGMVERDAQIILKACEDILEKMEQELYLLGE